MKELEGLHSKEEALQHSNNLLTQALKDISLGAGRYSEDRLTWAQNTIEDMQQIAVDVLEKTKHLKV